MAKRREENGPIGGPQNSYDRHFYSRKARNKASTSELSFLNRLMYS